MGKEQIRPVNDFEDATIVAYLAYRGHQVTPCKKLNGRIVFTVTGDIARDVEAFYQNQNVGVLDYIRILKMIRSSIFNLRAMKGNGTV